MGTFFTILKGNGKVISNNISERMKNLNIMKSRGLSVNTERVSDAFIEECCLIIKDTKDITKEKLDEYLKEVITEK